MIERPRASGLRPQANRGRVVLALFALYFIWGSSFLGIRIALEGLPPLFISGARYTSAGLALYALARLRGAPRPSLAEWKPALLVGVLLVAGNACVVVGEQWVSSGMAAVVLASIPLWVALAAGLFGMWPTGNEWIGLAVGLAGVLVLQTAGDLRASPAGAIALVLSCIVWALGSVLSSRLALTRGLVGSAMQMLAGGVVVLFAAFARGEHVPAAAPLRSWLALAYLAVFGSIVAYTAYQFLLATVRPTLAASYAYINPVVAVALGALVFGETVAPRAVFALAMILGGVALLAMRRAPGRALPDRAGDA